MTLRDAIATRDITMSVSNLAIKCNDFIEKTIAPIVDERATEGHSTAKIDLDQKDFGYQFTYGEISMMLRHKLEDQQYRISFGAGNKSIYVGW